MSTLKFIHTKIDLATKKIDELSSFFNYMYKICFFVCRRFTQLKLHTDSFVEKKIKLLVRNAAINVVKNVKNIRKVFFL